MNEKKDSYVKEKLYDGKLPSNSLIKKDLEYVAHNWRSPSFDLWEEVLGDHFYTRMVQRRALIEGSKFALKMGDTGAADFYKKEAESVEKSLNNFWDAQKGYYVATINRVGGLDYKASGIDSAFALALIHGSLDDGFMPLNDSKVISTLDAIETAFAKLYPINNSSSKDKSGKKKPDLAPAIGRYPEDQYAGSAFGANLGNPWPLCTLAFAEVYYRMTGKPSINNFKTKFKGKLNNKNYLKLSNIQKADLFVARVEFHANPDGSLNEQIDRNNGYMSSVSDLTWNYAAILSTYSTKAFTSKSH
jgi:glucoamylase